MSDQDNDSKTEEPTGKRLTEAMEQGQFARSQELQVVFILSGAFAAISFSVGSAARDVMDLSINVFTQLGRIRLQLDTVPTTINEMLLMCGRILAPLLVATIIAAVMAGGLQSGFQLSPKAFGFKPERLNPIPGFQRMFDKSVLVHAGIDFLKLIAIGLILWSVAKTLMKDPMFTAPVEAAYLGQYLERATYAFLSRLILALGCIAALSFAYEKFKTHKELMMSPQEIKEESKQMEGSPHAKQAMRRMARRLLQKQMLAAVPTADVVVTNPTHYAVALKYEHGIDKAPVVLAKGENGLAKRIKALAAENGVPMMENRPVARALYAFGKVGEPIPMDLYQAVAQILAFVYRTHRYYFFRLKARRAEAQAQQSRELALAEPTPLSEV
jgi:flagellar biosynthetic protein FlhB